MKVHKLAVMIAKALREVKPATANPTIEQWAADCAAISRVLEVDNPAFISSRFFKECGIGEFS